MRQMSRSAGRKAAGGKSARSSAVVRRRLLPHRAAFWRSDEPKKPEPRSRRRGKQSRLDRLWTGAAEAGVVRWQSPVAVGAFLVLALIHALIAGDHMGSIGRGIGATVDGGLSAAGLEVDTVSVTGRERARMSDILTALGVMRGDSILSFDTDRARARIEQIGWVSSANVQRLFPDKVLIEIHERQPYAVWQQDGGFSVIDRTGTRLNGLSAPDFSHLPRVVGAGAADGAGAILDEVERHPAIGREVEAAVRVAERRWNLRMKSGIDIMLPEGEFKPAIDELGRLEAEHQILSRDIRLIDFRVADRVTIQLSDEAAERRRASAKAAARSKGKSG